MIKSREYSFRGKHNEWCERLTFLKASQIAVLKGWRVKSILFGDYRPPESCFVRDGVTTITIEFAT